MLGRISKVTRTGSEAYLNSSLRLLKGRRSGEDDTRATTPDKVTITGASTTGVPSTLRVEVSHLITDDGYQLLKDNLKPGDLILGLKRYHLSPFEIPLKNLFNEFYTHAAMYVGEFRGVPLVIETHPEVRLTPLKEFMRRYKLDVYRANLTDEDRNRVVEAALSFMGKPYEFDMFLRDLDDDVRKVLSGEDIERLYCSKLVFMAYKKAFGDRYKTQKVKLLNRKFVTPQGLSHSILDGKPLFTKLEFHFKGDEPSWYLSQEDKDSLNFRRKWRKLVIISSSVTKELLSSVLGALRGALLSSLVRDHS